MAKGIDWSRILASAHPIVLMYFIAHGHVGEYNYSCRDYDWDFKSRTLNKQTFMVDDIVSHRNAGEIMVIV